MNILSYNGNHHTRKLEGQSLTWNGTCVEIWLESISPLNTLGPEPIWICLQNLRGMYSISNAFVSVQWSGRDHWRIYESPLTKSKSVAPESYCNFKRVILKNISWYSLGPHSSALLPSHFNKKNIRLIDIFILQNSLKVHAKDLIDDKSTFVPGMVKAAIILIAIYWWQTVIQ